MPLPRSFLYVPANREKFLDKAMALPADAFILDLEDSVPVPEKENARAGVKAYAPKLGDHRVWVCSTLSICRSRQRGWHRFPSEARGTATSTLISAARGRATDRR